MSKIPQCPLTSANGAPIAEDQNSITAGERGSVTFDNWRMFEKLAHFNRERIPERVVHARGTGAYGTFTLTRDLSEYTIARFLQGKGKKTEIFQRFSTVGGGQDSSDYARDPRGFSVKFYTEQGNWDMVGNNTPVFFLRDGIKFPDFIHSQKKDPATNLPDPARAYESMTRWRRARRARWPQSQNRRCRSSAKRLQAWDTQHEDNFTQAGTLYRIMSDAQKTP